jgi:Ca2+/Na+ antiporter
MAIFGFSSFLAIVGVASYLAFIIYSFACKKAEAGTEKHDIESTKGLGEASDSESDDEEDHANTPLWKGVAFLLVGGGLIFAFSEPFIKCAVIFIFSFFEKKNKQRS